MSEVTIRRVDGRERAEAVYETAIYAYGATPPMPEREKWLEENSKENSGDSESCSVAVYEDGHAAAVVHYNWMPQNIRGRLVRMAGVGGVAAAPETRRKGYVRQGMAAAYAEMRSAGIPVSTLYPFRESFYERLGYACLTYPLQVTIPTASLAPLVKQDLGGSVERIPAEAGIEPYRAYLEEMRTRVHGMGFVDKELEAKLKDSGQWMLLARENGQVTGVMLYRIREEARWVRVIDAQRFYYKTPLARQRLLEWIGRHVDQVEKAEIFLPPWEQPQLWMVDLKPRMEFSLAHAPMGRVIDLAALTGTPAGEGRFTVQVEDPYCPWNCGTWRFEGSGGALSVQKTESAGDTLGIQGVSAWLYGCVDPVDFASRGWGKLTPETVGAMRAVLPFQPTFLHEFF